MRKKDEMEQKLSNRSMKITWFVTVMTLFIIGFIQLYNTGERNIFLVIASSSVILNLFLERFYLSKVNKDRSFIKIVALTIVLMAIMLLIVWWSGS
ncbi:DUF6442 family protein [Hutsoniella sourekii]|uniref:DUF6442 family protein n=1 Tax=Hutsoniella sourekii TaxID=87650 RepID=UPI000488FA24|nr:DUF6442 family protein [Hutsoniella sourekii]